MATGAPEWPNKHVCFNHTGTTSKYLLIRVKYRQYLRRQNVVGNGTHIGMVLFSHPVNIVFGCCLVLGALASPPTSDANLWINVRVDILVFCL
jgi:hypothetical protein